MQKNELRSIMAKYGDNNQTLAEALGITSPALSLKINGKSAFSVKHIKVMIDRYNLDGDDVQRIFFAS